MKIVVIADNLGNNAPGIVFRNLIKGLSSRLAFDLITATPNPDVEVSGNVYHLEHKPINSWRIRTVLFSIFGYYHTQQKWANSIQPILEIGGYDVVISCMSSTFYASVTAADIYAQSHKCKHICYCVDAVPAPFPWEKNRMYSKAMKRLVRRRMQHIDYLCMTNKEMLNYEVSIIGNSQIKTIVLPNPPKYNELIYLENLKQEPSFAYAGKLYGLRNPDALLEGFSIFRSKHPEAKLYFIGSGNLEESLQSRSDIDLTNVEFIGFTNDLEAIYSKCIGLIDVNANIDNDVFLSSKVVSYLPYNRIIISESGANSPVRNVFTCMQTLLHVSHKAVEIGTAMEYAFKMNSSVDFNERNQYLKSMNIESAIDSIVKITK